MVFVFEITMITRETTKQQIQRESGQNKNSNTRITNTIIIDDTKYENSNSQKL